MPIPSSPATFDGSPTGTIAVSFAIPAGTYTSAIWQRDFTLTSAGSTGLTYGTIGIVGENVGFTNSLHSPGRYVENSDVATAGILAAINAAAGGTFVAIYTKPRTNFGQTITVNSLALTLSPDPSGGGGGGAIMATQGVINPANVVFARGYLFGTIAGGLADDVPLAELQEITVKVSQELKEMMGPESRFAIAVGVSGKKCVVTAKFGKFRARMVQMLLGGSAPTTSTGVTTVNIGVASDPVPFNLHLKSPSDGSDFEMKVFGLIATDLQIPVKIEDFIYPDFNANAYGDGTNVIQLLLPGDQTAS